MQWSWASNPTILRLIHSLAENQPPSTSLDVAISTLKSLQQRKLMALKYWQRKNTCSRSRSKKMERGKIAKGEFTLLTVGRGRVLQEAYNPILLNLPPHKESSLRAYCQKYSEYHIVYGHSTDEWQALKYKLEKLIWTRNFETCVDKEGRWEREKTNNNKGWSKKKKASLWAEETLGSS